ncbi:hypothetical protein [Mycoplasmopsis gallinarum]|uniref:DivIVA domain-containing protein n=1 Tax=Mycoplasmopsis gallinarum TaxID=29557 RepID=A0A168RAR5_9BACT|nr:hypothetical protein [Mycoplasmopsis gallinarum]OAB48789.1 hypothetical protein MGALLINA_05060 [Mycoplasmopsis gallinarum]
MKNEKLNDLLINLNFNFEFNGYSTKEVNEHINLISIEIDNLKQNYEAKINALNTEIKKLNNKVASLELELVNKAIENK